MKKTASSQKFPLIRNLMFFQSLLLLLGIGALAVAYFIEIRNQKSSLIAKTRSQLEPVLLAREGQWRAWAHFGLQESLKAELDLLRASYPIKTIVVVSEKHIKAGNDMATLIFPKQEELGALPLQVVAEIDVDRISEELKSTSAVTYAIWFLGLVFIFTITGTAIYVRRQFYSPLSALAANMTSLREGSEVSIEQIAATGEIRDVLSSINEMYVKTRQISQDAALGRLASQVAHDIRSPLVALNSLSNDLLELDVEKRTMLRSAVNRINDIANDLLSKNRFREVFQDPIDGEVSEGALLPQLISSLIDSLIGEKRLQFSSIPGIRIDRTFEKDSYSLFASVQPAQFNRVISNLINNAVEAIVSSGEVHVLLSTRNGNVEISIVDNGPGIHQDVLARLGQRGQTYGKKGGSGLGIFHARDRVEAWSGTLKFSSIAGKGTSAVITLPASEPPEWFHSSVRCKPNQVIVILDDDPSIHDVWRARFREIRSDHVDIQLQHLYSPAEFSDWVVSLASADRAIYLVDFEFMGHSETGLQLIERFGLSAQSILVTSRFDELRIQSECKRVGVGLIPKGMMGYVPVCVVEPHKFFDAVLLDDDELVRSTWEVSAKKAESSLLLFNEPTSFFVALENVDRNSAIYIDSNLGGGIRGQDLVKKVLRMGFGSIFLTTGYDASYIGPVPGLTAIVGKDPPFRKGGLGS